MALSVGYKRYPDDEEVNLTGDGDGEGDDVDPDVPLFEEDYDDYNALLSGDVLTKNLDKVTSKKCSIITILLSLLCLCLTIGFVVVLWKYVSSNNMRNFNKNKRDTSLFQHFVHISDTHLDIYYDCNVTNQDYQFCRNRKNIEKGGKILKSETTATFGRVKCDSPFVLLESLKNHLQKVTNDLKSGVEFIILTGDQVAHRYKSFDVDLSESILWSIGNSSKTISDALPEVPLLMSVGNNDLEVHNMPPLTNHSAFYQSLYEVFVQYVFPEGSDISHLNSKDEFKKTFLQGGYYSIAFNGGNMLVIVLNTNYWYATSYNLNNNVTIIGDVQMRWLHEQLDTAKEKGQKVLVTGHIPPGIDVWNKKSLWLQNYTLIYTKMISVTFSHVIMGQLYGHTHLDKIMLQYISDEHNSYLLTCPSVTPLDGNNPAFRVYDYDAKELLLRDYTQYYLDLAASNVNKAAMWFKEYSFRDIYKEQLSVEYVNQLINTLLLPSSPVWFRYSQHIRTKMGGVFYYERYLEFCAARYFTEDAYTKCIKKYKNIGI